MKSQTQMGICEQNKYLVASVCCHKVSDYPWIKKTYPDKNHGSRERNSSCLLCLLCFSQNYLFLYSFSSGRSEPTLTSALGITSIHNPHCLFPWNPFLWDLDTSLFEAIQVSASFFLEIRTVFLKLIQTQKSAGLSEMIQPTYFLGLIMLKSPGQMFQ